MKLVCPEDRAPLAEESGTSACPACGRLYAEADGILDCFRPDLIRNPVARAVTEQAIAHYDATATQYAGTDADIPPDYPVVRGLQAALRATITPRVIVDLGCGTGRYFEQYRDAETVIGLDASRPMLAAARRGRADWLAKRGVSVRLARSTCDATPIPDGAAGLVIAIGILGYHLPLDPSVLQEIRRILAPGGRAFLVTHVRPTRSLTDAAKHYIKFGFIARLPAPIRRLPRSYLSQLFAEPEDVRRVSAKVGLTVLESRLTDERVWQNQPLVLSLLEKPV